MQLVHLVYVHGFQGNDTTFQSFPTDLQQYLSTHIPTHLGLKIQSSIYPTYKSVKAISFATKNFLEWLSTQPPGPVILMGHSMGGLLAADAATHISNNPDGYPGAKPCRIVGLIAFDTPYLGMHPHVVISGIASLVSKDEDKNKDQTPSNMNDTSQVNIIDEKVTEDWDAFKKNTNRRSLSPMPASPIGSPPPSPSISTASNQPRLSPLPFVDRTLTFLSSHSNDPIVRWARKHADDPFSAGKRWVVERFQFGACMFDPSGLKSRYSRLVAWQGGHWVNYWTQTVPKQPSGHQSDPVTDHPTEQQAIMDNDAALLQTGTAPNSEEPTESTPTESSSSPSSLQSPPISTAPTKSEAKALEKERKKVEKTQEKALKKEQKQREADAKAMKKAEQAKGKLAPGRHFVVLPTGLGQVLGGGEKWEKVLIGGVEDEVAAHCGLFIRGQNLDYDGLVDRVGTTILRWCETM